MHFNFDTVFDPSGWKNVCIFLFGQVLEEPPWTVMASMEMIDKEQNLLQVKSESRVKEIPCHLNFLSSYVEKKRWKFLFY